VRARDIELIVVDDEEAAARECAQRLVEAARAARQIVLTGGSTPKRAYELAATFEPDWSRAELWWGDERCVPPDDSNSNYGMAKSALLDRLREPPLAVHRIRGELGKEEAAEQYERELDATALDLVLLGLGPDGHVASLFPNFPTLEVTDRRVVPTEAGHEPFVDRVSLTLPALCGAEAVLFLATGASKADAAAKAFAGDPDPSVPGSLVRAANGRTAVILDRAAAAALPR
jgi:6-phosphogluconolactonase